MDIHGTKDFRLTGLVVFLLSLSALLGAGMIGYVVIRLRAPTWPPEGVPHLPGTLWISTLLLLLGSLTIHYAVVSLKLGKLARFRGALTATLTLGVLFLLSQVWNGAEVLGAVAERPRELFSFTFLMLAILHGVHVLGGLVPLAIVTRRAWKGRYAPEDPATPRLISIYWHFLDVVWLLMFGMLML